MSKLGVQQGKVGGQEPHLLHPSHVIQRLPRFGSTTLSNSPVCSHPLIAATSS